MLDPMPPDSSTENLKSSQTARGVPTVTSYRHIRRSAVARPWLYQTFDLLPNCCL